MDCLLQRVVIGNTDSHTKTRDTKLDQQGIQLVPRSGCYRWGRFHAFTSGTVGLRSRMWGWVRRNRLLWAKNVIWIYISILYQKIKNAVTKKSRKSHYQKKKKVENAITMILLFAEDTVHLFSMMWKIDEIVGNNTFSRVSMFLCFRQNSVILKFELVFLREYSILFENVPFFLRECSILFENVLFSSENVLFYSRMFYFPQRMFYFIREYSIFPQRMFYFIRECSIFLRECSILFENVLFCSNSMFSSEFVFLRDRSILFEIVLFCSNSMFSSEFVFLRDRSILFEIVLFYSNSMFSSEFVFLRDRSILFYFIRIRCFLPVWFKITNKNQHKNEGRIMVNVKLNKFYKTILIFLFFYRSFFFPLFWQFNWFYFIVK